MSAKALGTETEEVIDERIRSDQSDANSGFAALIVKLRGGDNTAAQQLLDRYWKRLRVIAGRRIGRTLQAKVDPDDVLQSALASFFLNLTLGHWDFDSSRSLRGLLSVLIARKCNRYAAKFATEGRDINREQSLLDENGQDYLLGELPGREPAPDDAIVRQEWLEYNLETFDDQDRAVIACILEGRSTLETATAIKCSQRTVQRTILRVVRALEQNPIHRM